MDNECCVAERAVFILKEVNMPDIPKSQDTILPNATSNMLPSSPKQQAMEALFGTPTEITKAERPKTHKRLVAAAGASTLAVAGAIAADKLGVAPSDLMQSWAPPVPFRKEIVDGMVTANDSLRTVAPFAAVVGLSAQLALSKTVQKFVGTKRGERLAELAKIDYSGTDDIVAERSSHNNKTRRARVAKFFAGAGVAALVIFISGGSSGVEDEISNGSNRPVAAMFDAFGGGEDDKRYLVTDHKFTTMMDDSAVPKDSVRNLAAFLEGRYPDSSVVPVSKILTRVDDLSGLAIGVPDEVFEASFGAISPHDYCEGFPVVVDEVTNAEIGDTIKINGQDASVVNTVTGFTAINRDLVIVPESDMDKCVAKTIDATYFGALVSGKDLTMEQVEQALLDLGIDKDELVAITQQQFTDNNRDFWQKNGTPILLQLMMYSGVLGGVAIANDRRNNMQKNVREIAAIRVAGIQSKDIRRIEDRRALNEVFKATLLGGPAIVGAAALFNAAERGFMVRVGLREVAVGYIIALVAKLYGGRRAAADISKTDLSKALRG